MLKILCAKQKVFGVLLIPQPNGATAFRLDANEIVVCPDNLGQKLLIAPAGRKAPHLLKHILQEQCVLVVTLRPNFRSGYRRHAGCVGQDLIQQDDTAG